LTLYNLASAAGWAAVLYITILSYTEKATPTQYWSQVGYLLKIVQTAAALEVFHSLFGLVKSPLFTTLMQVSSRLVLLWCYTAQSAASQASWSIFLMVGSWAAVEVPRYLFYAVNIHTKTVPFPLFFLRYNLFLVLYPSGISGEVLQMIAALPELSKLPYKLTLTLLAVYLPAGPFMVANMWSQRNRAAKARAEALKATTAAAPAANGLLFPESGDGDRSTTAAGKAIFADSIKAVSPDDAAAALAEKNWRFGYAKHVVKNVELSLASPDAAIAIAKSGLESALSSFDFVRDGSSMKLKEAMSSLPGSFETGFIKGTKPKSTSPFVVPYKGTPLSEAALLEQLNKWAAYGTIEPSARDAIAWVVNNPSCLDLSKRHFVLLGAGSAMGPLLVLLSLGANVIAVDLNLERIWDRLLKLAKESSGTLTFPLSKPASQIPIEDLAKFAGCNLFTQTPEVKNWLVDVAPGSDLVIGGYAYLDSAAHVQVSLAMVAIMEGVMAVRPGTSFAFLCSPTDVFVSPPEAVDAVKANLKNVPLWQKAVQALSGGRVLKPNLRKPVNGQVVVNGIVVAQGPNYALAKRLQHWFAIIARSKSFAVSSNVAPSTATVSVVHNAQFAAAYGGFKYFKPMEVFMQDTSNAVMGALLIHDVANPKSVAHPSVPLANQILLFSGNSFHGGIWRNAFTIDSIGAVAAVAYYLNKYAPYLGVGAASFGAYLAWLIQ